MNDNHVWDDSDVYFAFGLPGDEPVTGDWNDNGIDDIGVFRDGLWFLDADGNREWADGDIELFRFCVTHDKKDELVCLSFDCHFTSHNQHLLAEDLLEY